VTTILAGNPLKEICGLTVLQFRLVSATLFQSSYKAIPKSDLSTYVLCLMMYLMSYDLYHMSYLIPISYGLMALVYVLFLGLRLSLTIS
jgi:hypothetical protein